MKYIQEFLVLIITKQNKKKVDLINSNKQEKKKM